MFDNKSVFTLSILIVAITRFSTFAVPKIVKKRGIIAGAVDVSLTDITEGVCSVEAGFLALWLAMVLFVNDVRNTYSAGW